MSRVCVCVGGGESVMRGHRSIFGHGEDVLDFVDGEGCGEHEPHFITFLVLLQIIFNNSD